MKFSFKNRKILSSKKGTKNSSLKKKNSTMICNRSLQKSNNSS